MKKRIAIVLCLILCLSLLPMAVMADEAEITVHAKAPASWSGINLWAWVENGENDQPIFKDIVWPGVPMAQDGDWYTMKVPGTITGIVLNTNEGSVQTKDLTVEPGKDVWIVVDDGNTGHVFYEEPTGDVVPTTTPAPAAGEKYQVVGSGSIFGTDWEISDDHLMTKNDDGTWSKTYTDVAAGTLGLKVMQDGTIWIPDGMGNETIVEVPTDGSTVVVTFDPATAALSVKITGSDGKPVEQPTEAPAPQPTEAPVAPQPTEPSQDETPKGGISGIVAALIAFAVVAGIGVAVVLVLRKKKMA